MTLAKLVDGLGIYICLFLAVVLPSATYGLSSIHTNETLDFLDEVQGRLIKAWFGVSK